ncbi:MAG: ThiF family adenylyltransferase, partial [Chloroflexota bacterium]
MPLIRTVHAAMNVTWFQQAALAKGASAPVRLWGIGEVAISKTKLSDLQYWDAQLRIPEVPWGELNTRELGPRRDIDAEDFWVDIPWIFISGPADSPSGKRLNDEIHTTAELLKIAAAAGCESQLREVLELSPTPKALANARVIVFVIGTWRPIPLIPDLPGLADGAARNLDLRAFMAIAESKDGKVEYTSLLELAIAAELTPELLAKISALPRPPDDCAFIGIGALGSKVVNALAREGIGYASLTDEGTFAPHNITRHVLTGRHVGFSKAKGMSTLLKEIRNKTIEVRARKVSIEDVPLGKLTDVVGKRPKWIVDASADSRALARLMRPDNVLRVIRVEMSDAGKLGILAVEGVGRNPDIYDLKATLYAAADEEAVIGDWLTGGESLTEVRTGLSCASVTFQLPDSTVGLHASAFMSEINRALTGESNEAGVLLNFATSWGRPAGSLWL